MPVQFLPPQLVPLLPLMFMAAGILLVLLYGAFSNNAKGSAVLAMVVSLASAGLWLSQPAFGSIFPHADGYFLTLSPYSRLASIAILLLGTLCMPLAPVFLTEHKKHKPEYYVLVLLSMLGMLVLVNSANFLTFYVGLELMSFALYILCAFLRNDARSSEAGLKYLVLGGLASGLLLYGISLLYLSLGSTSFHVIGMQLNQAMMALAEGQGPQPLALIALALVLMGTLFKLSSVPFHMWTPDVYQGAPTPVTAIMIFLPKLAAAVVLVRLLALPFAALAPYWQPLIATVSLLSMVLGSTMAIIQTDLKRLLAWSTVTHVGFILTGVVAVAPVGLAQVSPANMVTSGAASVLLYLIIYGLTSISLFAIILGTKVSTTAQLPGLLARSPAATAALGLSMFSLAGIPPLSGFFAKFAVFAAAIGAGYSWLAVVGVVCSVIACFYSLYLIKLATFDTPATTSSTSTEAPPQPWLVALGFGCALAVLLLGVFPSLLTTWLVPAAKVVF